MVTTVAAADGAIHLSFPGANPLVEIPNVNGMSGGRLRVKVYLVLMHVYITTSTEQVLIRGKASRLNPSQASRVRRACTRDVTTADQSEVWEWLTEEY